MKEFLIPSGTKDYILEEALNKKRTQVELEKNLDRWGYREVMTPTIEYYKTFSLGFDDMKEEDVYKFFDQNGRIVTLRQDMTIPIARLVATKFKDTALPLRLRYTAPVFKVNRLLSGIQNEETDIGAELIGETSQSADLEIVALAFDVLKIVQNKKYTLELGQIEYFNCAFEELLIDNRIKQKLASYIDGKRLTELNHYVDGLKIEEKEKNFFKELPWLNGNVDILKKAKTIAISQKQIKIVEELESLTNSLMELGYDNITIDLGKVPRLNYYTGIIFEAFVDGVGLAVLSGGRYDKLISKFNRDLPAVGFAVKLERIIEAVKLDLDYKERFVIQYPYAKEVEAIKMANTLREKAIVELKLDDSLIEVEVDKC